MTSIKKRKERLGDEAAAEEGGKGSAEEGAGFKVRLREKKMKSSLVSFVVVCVVEESNMEMEED